MACGSFPTGITKNNGKFIFGKNILVKNPVREFLKTNQYPGKTRNHKSYVTQLTDDPFKKI
jgi:hypothetical protein